MKRIISLLLIVMILVSAFSVFSVNASDSAFSSSESKTLEYSSYSFNIGLNTNSDFAKSNLTYSSGDSKVATVDNSGNVSVKGCGETTVTAKTKIYNPNYFADKDSYINVSKNVSLKVNPNKASISIKKTNKKKNNKYYKKIVVKKQPNCKYEAVIGYINNGKYIKLKVKKSQNNANYIEVGVPKGYTFYAKARAYVNKDQVGDWSDIKKFKA